jgi:hypothetical protein
MMPQLGHYKTWQGQYQQLEERSKDFNEVMALLKKERAE